MNNQTYKGTYKPKNTEKYVGQIENITYRSRWEREFMKWLDSNPKVVKWSSETAIIPYISKVDKKPHRYFVDFSVEFSDGKIILFEIKPFKETQPPKKPQRRTRRFYEEVKTYAVNISKWEAASKFAEKNQVSFQILTEHELKKLGIKLL